MTTLLKCFPAEIGLSLFDQPVSSVGSTRIDFANLFSCSAFTNTDILLFVFVKYLFYLLQVLQHPHIMTGRRVYLFGIHQQSDQKSSKGQQEPRLAAKFWFQNLVLTLLIEMTKAIRMMCTSAPHPGHHLSPLQTVCVRARAHAHTRVQGERWLSFLSLTGGDLTAMQMTTITQYQPELSKHK